MAGNWIKMGVGLRTHPKVVRMASALKADRLRVIGGLHAVWSIFDAHTADGLLEGYTSQAIDEDLGWRGFADAMRAVGWLIASDDGLRVPEYTEHNGATAKRRAMETSRKGRSRNPSAIDAPKCYANVPQEFGQMFASNADKVRNREEKSREDLTKEADASLDPVVLGGGAVQTPEKLPAVTDGVSAREPPTRAVWEAYSAAYEVRYGQPPVRNARVAGQLAAFLKRVPAAEAPGIAAWFVRSNKAFYTAKGHPVSLLLADAEALRTDWATRAQRTETEARQGDRTQATGNVFNKLIEEFHGPQPPVA
ncbi:MAG: hypothetical protein IPP91_11185 [Betaproteobacteria bacterium]|nr:hypothetical protein [Betaproteobacteria bacterium]